MFAVVEDRGRQFRVREGEAVEVDRIRGEVGTDVSFDKVVMVGDGGSVRIGSPYISGARVIGVIEKHFLGEKVIFIHRVLTNSLGKRRGHRARRTLIRVRKIESA
ncbi:MAG: 50S ribosomal protein L21 [Planctomycetota bacterium]|nr:50S ribosomal protein L21 [Planctomycetota bacterium]